MGVLKERKRKREREREREHGSICTVYACVCTEFYQSHHVQCALMRRERTLVDMARYFI